MVKLDEIMDTDLLAKHVADGNVSVRWHNELPLHILNYTPQCQYARTWDDVTKKCRGLIVHNETGEVVARPFEKFYNWDESGAPFPPSGPALRMPKMDGSLGILYTFENEIGDAVDNGAQFRFGIATRGSFHSEQAQWATEWLYKSSGFWDFFPKKDKTYLFEIIYPENRIVVDYGEYEGLTLIDVIDNITGFADTDEFDNFDWDDKVIRKPVAGFDSGQAVDIPDGDEGFVYLWPTRNFRTKMKAAEYVRIHRLVSGLTEKSIWQHLVNGGTLGDLKRDLPEEFHDFIDNHGNELMRKASAIVQQVYLILDQITIDLGQPYDTVDRKSFAMQANRYKYHTKYLYAALDNKPVFPIALAAVKPQREVSLVKED